MRNFEEIKSDIIKMCENIGLSARDIFIYNSVQNDGTPYIQIIDDIYLYISEERGSVFFEKKTSNISQLYYWIMADLISSFSYKFELNNRIEGQDFRRIVFQKQIQLFGMICNEWKIQREDEIKKILLRSPFNDE